MDTHESDIVNSSEDSSDDDNETSEADEEEGNYTGDDAGSLSRALPKTTNQKVVCTDQLPSSACIQFMSIAT